MLKSVRMVSILFCIQLFIVSGAGAAELPELNWEPRSDWLDVTKDVEPRAKGDGKADDTAAIQAAIDKLGDWESGDPVGAPKTVFLPVGTYRITKALHLSHIYGAAIIGCGKNTRILWDGKAAKDAVMFWSDGSAHARYTGIVWDGNNKAGIGFRHAAISKKENGQWRGYFETQNMHQHEAFVNCTQIGLSLGDPSIHLATDTTQIENCIFQNCGKGIAVEQFNFYHYPIVNSLFLDCGTAINFVRGMGYVRNCHFERSRNEDIFVRVGHPVSCSVRWSTSLDSKRFITCSGGGWTNTFDAIDCRVSGWKDEAGAIVANNAGTMLFSDIVFENPPSKTAPIKLINKYPLLMTISNLKSLGTKTLIDKGSNVNVVEIPAGNVKPIITDARQSFFQKSVNIPSKIIDAKRDFGAKGNGKADDTAAIQATINAAQKHGKGAMAYFPTGRYKVTKTLVMSGSNYYVGGTNTREHCRLEWGGAANTTMLSVQNPQNLNLQYLELQSGAPKMQVCAIRQEGRGGPSHMTYEVVKVPGAYAESTPRPRGFEFSNLTKGDVVVGRGDWDGEIRISNCGRATILIDDSIASPLTVEGKEPVRDGFIGFHAFMGLCCGDPLIAVRDNQNLVIGEAYLEQTLGTHVLLEGSPGDPEGYVTIFGSERYVKNPQKTPDSWDLLVVRNYKGRYCEATNGFDYAPPKGYRIVQSGSRPIDMIFLANAWMITKSTDRDMEPEFVLGEKATLIRVNDTIFDCNGSDKPGDRDLLGTFPERISNVIPAGGLNRVAAALDDLRRLGQVDWQLKQKQ